MTTVVDPSGTPIIIFNATGVAIISIASPNTPDPPATVNPTGAGVTVVMCSRIIPTGFVAGYKLSASFNVGDVVELYSDGSNSFKLFDENSNYLADIGPGGYSTKRGTVMRKIANGSGRNWGHTYIA